MPPQKKRIGSGRPPKFQEPSAPITLTLPRRIVRDLETIDRDRAKAIVKCVETVLAYGAKPTKKIELISIADDAAILVIGPCRSLQNIPWVHLVEITPARFLVTIPAGTPMPLLEVALLDLIETLPDEFDDDRETLKELRHQLSSHRRQDQVKTQEIFLLNPNLTSA